MLPILLCNGVLMGNWNTVETEPEAKETPKRVAAKQEVPEEERKERNARLRQKWGSKYNADGKAIHYSEDELLELENIYQRQAAEYKGAITQRIDMALQEISINRLEWKRSIGKGDSISAKRYSDNIKVVMDREGMKANDEKPLEAIKIDGVINALERRGAAFDGRIVGRDELIRLINESRGTRLNSIDVVDEMLFAIINTMRKNNSQEELTELPKEAQVVDTKGELHASPTREEKAIMEELGIIPPAREK